MLEKAFNVAVCRRRSRDNQIAIELGNAVSTFATFFPVGIHLVVDELLELIDQFAGVAALWWFAGGSKRHTAATATAAATAAAAATTESTTTAATAGATTATATTAAGLHRLTEVEFGGVVKVGRTEQQVADVVNESDLLLLNASLGGDDHNAVLHIKGERLARRLVTVLGDHALKHSLDGRLHIGATKVNGDRGLLRLKSNFLQLRPVDQEVDLGLILEVVACLLKGWASSERHRDGGGLDLVPRWDIHLGLAVATRAVIRLANTAIAELLPIFWVGHQCVG